MNKDGIYSLQKPHLVALLGEAIDDISADEAGRAEDGDDVSGEGTAPSASTFDLHQGIRKFARLVVLPRCRRQRCRDILMGGEEGRREGGADGHLAPASNEQRRRHRSIRRGK